MSFVTRLATGIAVVLLAGCSLPSLSPTSHTLYTLDLPSTVSHQYAKHDSRLLVGEMLGAGYIESRRIIFQRVPMELGAYQYAFWADFPTKQLTDALVRQVQDSGMFVSASRVARGVVGDYQLNTELIDFLHDVMGHQVKVTISAEVLDLRTRAIVDSTRISVAVPVESDSAEGAVRGFSNAVDEVLFKLLDWLDRATPER